MGPDEQTTSDSEADAFFATFIDASPEVIACVAAEAQHHTGPDLAGLVAEAKAFGYWDRKMATRAARRVARQRIAAAETIAAATRWTHPDPAARLAPLLSKSLALLPAPRVVRLTEQERRETRAFWQHLAGLRSGSRTAYRLVQEAREAAVRERRAAAQAKRDSIVWRREQREFERSQWATGTTRGQRAEWRRKKIALRWVAISEQRALEIALDVYDQHHPPQGDQ